MPAERYHFAYAEDSPYGHAVKLLAAHTYVQHGVVLDVGCGYGAIAEPVAELGLTYLGVDLEPAGVANLVERGFEAAVVDLADLATAGARLADLLAGRPLAAITALDVLEHLARGPDLIGILRTLSLGAGRAPLVVSIPNVAHLDLAAKLVIGRWDVTPTGLLDETHVSLYSPGRLDAVFEATGWAEVGRADFELVHSDQHFPPDAAVLAADAPLAQLIAAVRRQAAPGATTNQFVRALVPVTPPMARPDEREPAERGPDPSRPTPFLSVLVVVGPDRDRLVDTLVALDAQTTTDLEVVLCVRPGLEEALDLWDLLAPFAGRLGRSVQVVTGPSPMEVDHSTQATQPGTSRGDLLDAGVRIARGRYVSVLDDGAVPFAHYVEVLSRLALERPGSVVRSLGLRQALRDVAWPDGRTGYEPAEGAAAWSCSAFHLVDHLRQGGTPPGTYALPASCFADLGFSFSAALAGLEDDEVLAGAAMWCGLHEDTSTAILLQRLPEVTPGPETAHAPDRAGLIATFLDSPLLLPAGSLTALLDHPRLDAGSADDPGPPVDHQDQARAALTAAREELAAAQAELAALRASTSWQVTAPLRRLADRLPSGGRSSGRQPPCPEDRG